MRFWALPEWERAWHERRAQAARDLCPDCGLPLAQCSDPDREWFPQRVVCYASMEVAAAVGRYDRLHEKLQWHDGSFKKWAAEPSDRTPYYYKAGVRITVADRDLNPEDDFLGQVAAAPGPDQPPT